MPIKWKTYIYIIAIIIMALIGFKVCGTKTTKPLIFTIESWDSNPMDRYRMFDSLMTQYNGLKGMSRSEINDILGTNTLTVYSDTYIVGPGNGWGSESALLLQISFDEMISLKDLHFTGVNDNRKYTP